MQRTPPFTPPKGIWGNNTNNRPKTLLDRNLTRNPPDYEVGGLPGQVLSTGMRLDHTSPEFARSLNLGTNQGLRKSINSLESLQVRRTAWLTPECVDVPISHAYQCQPKAVRRRINILSTMESAGLFLDPEVGSGNGSGDGGGKLSQTRDELRTDLKFQKKLDEVYRTKSKLWKRIRAREFTIWPIHTTEHFVTIILRMRRSDPNAGPSTPYDEVAQFSILEPVGNLLMVKRIHRRLRRILCHDKIRIAEDAFCGLWYPKQHDGYSCGLRAYRMAKEFMERLSWILEPGPALAADPPDAVAGPVRALARPDGHDRGPDADGGRGRGRLRAHAVGAALQRQLQRGPGAAGDDDERRPPRRRARRLAGPRRRRPRPRRLRPRPDGRPAVAPEAGGPQRGARADPAVLRAPGPAAARGGEPDIQRFEGQAAFNPVQNPGSGPGRNRDQIFLDALANVTLDNQLKRRGESETGEEPAKKLTAKQWRRKRTKVTKLRKGRHDRYGPAFISAPAFRKVLGGRIKT
ncbi:hypothetical protein PG997_008214 [Apiospora hydei]|uniref:Ubiquitin-like protease family profile domain-containing protein n=1 Tax=Apiospora hydei TaxID=1337664 RepID=A0ABR1WA75_9PEZI